MKTHIYLTGVILWFFRICTPQKCDADWLVATVAWVNHIQDYYWEIRTYKTVCSLIRFLGELRGWRVVLWLTRSTYLLVLITLLLASQSYHTAQCFPCCRMLTLRLSTDVQLPAWLVRVWGIVPGAVDEIELFNGGMI